MKRKLLKSSRFSRTLSRLLKKQPGLADSLLDTFRLLEADAFDPKLKTHKLKGKLSGCWACSVDYDLRIIFEFVELEGQETIFLETIGSHDDVY